MEGRPPCRPKTQEGAGARPSNISRRFVNRRSLMSAHGMADLSFDPEIARRFPSAGRYLVGVSGGRDSVALLHLLAERGYRRLIVCHLDHQLRGRASKADAQFVERLAQSLEFDFESDRIDVAALSRRTKQSVETAARTARYKFFTGVARRRRCRTLFLGHHADDLVETFLLNLFRGAGPTGFRGMQAVANHTIAGFALTVVRPLLGITRQQIDGYLKIHRHKFRDDATNETLLPLRNRIRHRIIPYIEKQLGRNVCRALWRAAVVASDESDWLADHVESEPAPELSVKHLRVMPRALQRRTLQRWLQTRGIDDLDFETIERVRALLDPDGKTAKTNLPHDRHARRRAGKLFLE
jgi:tRNA(Ile)-lysidine synthase